MKQWSHHSAMTKLQLAVACGDEKTASQSGSDAKTGTHIGNYYDAMIRCTGASNAGGCS